MARHTSLTATEIRYSLHLIFDDKGNARMSRGPSSLKPNERDLQLTVKLPRSIFKTPALRGSIVIEEGVARDEIIAEVTHNAAEVLREHMGLQLQVEELPKGAN